LSDDDSDEETAWDKPENDTKLPPNASNSSNDNQRRWQQRDDAFRSRNHWDTHDNSSSSSSTNGSDDDDDEFEWTEELEKDSDDEEDDDSISVSSSSPIKDITNRTNNITIADDNNNDGSDDKQKKKRIQEPGKKKQSSNPKGVQPTTQKQRRREFRKHRDTWTMKYLQTYDRLVFDGRFLANRDALDQPTLLTVSWSNKLRTTAGRTRLLRHKTAKNNHLNNDLKVSNRTVAIELSTKVLDSLDRLKCTLLHEMCHAAQWILDDNARPMHGPIFKKWARLASQRTGVPISVRHNYEIVYKYAWQCEICHVIIQRHSRSISIERHRCGKCRGKLREVQPPTSTTRRGHNPQPSLSSTRQKRTETPYNRFVREQSSLVRQQLLLKQSMDTSTTNVQSVSQAQVMKECARLWRIQQQQSQASDL
jgi:predicted SprT family Zn-dependent metalloprotease